MDGARPERAENKTTLLLVEDDEMIRYLMVSLCEESGYQVIEAAKPSEALRVLGGDAWVDVLVTDFTLPEMNGIELIRKASVERNDLAVVLASGSSFGRNELPDDAVTILTKPFRPEDLQSAIQKSLALKRRTSALN